MAYDVDRANYWADYYGVPRGYFSNLIAAESSGDPNAVSSAGAIGLTQTMPDTFYDEGGTDIHDPDQQLKIGAQYLRKMYDSTGNWYDAAQAYNAGLAGVRNADTAAYADKVTGGDPNVANNISAANAGQLPGGVAPVRTVTPTDVRNLYLSTGGRMENPSEKLNMGAIWNVVNAPRYNPQEAMVNKNMSSTDANALAMTILPKYNGDQLKQAINGEDAQWANAAKANADLKNQTQNMSAAAQMADQIVHSNNSSNRAIYAGIAKMFGGQIPYQDNNMMSSNQLMEASLPFLQGAAKNAYDMQAQKAQFNYDIAKQDHAMANQAALAQEYAKMGLNSKGKSSSGSSGGGAGVKYKPTSEADWQKTYSDDYLGQDAYGADNDNLSNYDNGQTVEQKAQSGNNMVKQLVSGANTYAMKGQYDNAIAALNQANDVLASMNQQGLGSYDTYGPVLEQIMQTKQNLEQQRQEAINSGNM